MAGERSEMEKYPAEQQVEAFVKCKGAAVGVIASQAAWEHLLLLKCIGCFLNILVALILNNMHT